MNSQPNNNMNPQDNMASRLEAPSTSSAHPPMTPNATIPQPLENALGGGAAPYDIATAGASRLAPASTHALAQSRFAPNNIPDQTQDQAARSEAPPPPVPAHPPRITWRRRRRNIGGNSQTRHDPASAPPGADLGQLTGLGDNNTSADATGSAPRLRWNTGMNTDLLANRRGSISITERNGNSAQIRQEVRRLADNTYGVTMASGSFDSFTLNINNMLPIPADPEDEITLSIKINRQRARREAHAERRLEADQRREVANRRRPLQVEDTELQQAQQLQQLQAQQAQIEQQLLQARQFEAREAQRVQQLQIEQQQLQAQQTQLDQQLLQARQLEAQQAQQLRQLQLEQQRLQAQQAQLRGQPGARESHSPNTNQIQSQDNNQPGLGDATTDQPEDLQLPTFPTFSADGFNSDNHSPGAHASGSERESPFPLRPAHHNVSEIPSAAETSRQGFLNGDELYKSHTEDLWCETEPKSDTEMD